MSKIKKIIILLFLTISMLNCNSSNDEYVTISKKCISAMSRENPDELSNLFPVADMPVRGYSTLIHHLKRKFFEQKLQGWKTIEAKGYIQYNSSNKNKIPFNIIGIDGTGKYFVYEGVESVKNGNRLFFRLTNDDLYKFDSKEALIKRNSSGNIHWF